MVASSRRGLARLVLLAAALFLGSFGLIYSFLGGPGSGGSRNLPLERAAWRIKPAVQETITGLVFVMASALLVFGAVVLPRMPVKVSGGGALIYAAVLGLLFFSDPPVFFGGPLFLVVLGFALGFGYVKVTRDSLDGTDRLERSTGGWVPFSDGATRPRRDAAMEGDLWAISFWSRILAVVVGLAGVKQALTARYLFEPATLLVYAAALYATGHYLARLHRWALIVVGAHLVLNLVGTVIAASLAMVATGLPGGLKNEFSGDLGRSFGAALALFILCAVLQRRAYAVCTPQMRELALASPLESAFKRKSLYLRVPLIMIVPMAVFIGLAMFFAVVKGG